jgi:hypothetical protein
MAIMKNKLPGVFAAAFIFCMHPILAQAQVVDPLIEGAKLCTRHLQRYETQYGIPSHLLSAIASTESGRYHDGLKIRLPWPWTINAEGKGYYFDTKEEAIAAALKLQARGIDSIDVGCMQVNIHHHPGAFVSMAQAFEPENNVAYAASFLRNLYQDEGSWKKAASDYHSKTPDRGKQYVGLVYDSWFKIIDKLRSARLNVPDSSINGLRDMQRPQSSVQAAIPSGPKYIKVSDAAAGQKEAIYKTPSMKSIKVTSQGTVIGSNESRKRENGIIIVQPEISAATSKPEIKTANASLAGSETMVVADASGASAKQSILDLPPSAGAATPAQAAAADPGAKIIRIDNKLVSARHPVNTVTNKKSGPNFIFND